MGRLSATKIWPPDGARKYIFWRVRLQPRQGRHLCRNGSGYVWSPLRGGIGLASSPCLEDIPLVVINLELAKEFKVFLAKCLPCMVALLVLNVPDYGINLGSRVGKSPKTFLPGKSSAYPSLLVNKPRGVGFDIPN